MKKMLLVLSIMMLTKITAFSSTTSTDSILVSVNDIKCANLIFVEHKKLKSENQLLFKQIDNLNSINKANEQIDSLRKEQIKEYVNINTQYEKDLAKERKKYSRMVNLTIGGVTICAGLILFLILK